MATQTTSPRTTAAPVARRGALVGKKRQEQIVRVVATIAAVLGLLIVLFPLAWMFSTSLKTRIEVLKFPPTWIPVSAQWDNYRVALTVNPFGKYFLNSMYYACSVMIAELVSCSFIAYGFARLRAPGKNWLFLLVLATMMLPTWTTLIPQYIMFSKFGWLDSYKPLIVPHWFGSAYLIFMLRQFFRGLPKDYEEAAIIDGANYLGIWLRIILPLSLPALGAVAIMSFMFHYQDFGGPLIYINSQANYPVSLGLQQFNTPFGAHPSIY